MKATGQPHRNPVAIAMWAQGKSATTMEQAMRMFSKGSQQNPGTFPVFPDVCKTPAPPAPFAPVPYPNTQFEENIKRANAADSKANAGDAKSRKQVAQAIKNVADSMSGDEAGTLKVMSAGQAVRLGHTMHRGGLGKPTPGRQNAISMVLSGKRVVR